MSGWVKIHRQFLNWEWFNKSEAVHLFMYLLLKANHAQGTWQGNTINKGQFITSYGKISSDTGISIQTIRTLLKKLEKTNEINTQTTNKFTIITICKYETYQSEEIPTNKQLTSNQQTTNKQLTTNKNNKEEKERKKGSIEPLRQPKIDINGFVIID
jgi:DNA-binding transcriptional MerR regulator